jgi:hypothetical protein
MPNQSDTSTRVNLQLEQAIHAVLSDRPIAYHASLARALGSVTAGVLLSQFLYWQPRSRDPDGWFWKTQVDIADETALSRTETETARKVLVRAGVLEEKRRGVPAKMHFRINLTKVVELLSRSQERREGTPPTATAMASASSATRDDPQFAGFPQTRLQNSDNLDRGVPANRFAGTPRSITESTTETSPENTTETFNSNCFELKTQVCKKPSTSKFSKKRDGKIQVSVDSKNEKAPSSPTLGRDFAAAGKLLSGEGVSPPDKEAPRRLAKELRTASNVDDASDLGPAESAPPRPSGGRQPKTTGQIEAVLEQISGEFHDDEHVRSNIGQAARLWKASRLDEGVFLDRLFEARSVTKQQGGIEKRASGEAGEWGMRNKMPYFFVVLRDRLGMKEGNKSGG